MDFRPGEDDVAKVRVRERVDTGVRGVRTRANPRAPSLNEVLSRGIASINGAAFRRREVNSEKIAPCFTHCSRLKTAVTVRKQAQANAVSVFVDHDITGIGAV